MAVVPIIVSESTTIQKIKIKDERLDIDHIDHYSLSFFVGDQDLQISVHHKEEGRLLLFENYQAPTDARGLTDFVESVYHDHVLIAARFWGRINLTVKNDLFCLIPDVFFDDEHRHDYLQLNGRTDAAQDYYKDIHLKELSANFVFGIPQELLDWFEHTYEQKKINCYHQGVHFITGVYKQFNGRPEGLYVLFHADQMLVLGIHDYKVILYNQFPIREPEQLVKYAILAIRQFSFEEQNAPVHLWGIKDQVKTCEPVFRKYFRNITIGKKPAWLKMNHLFDDLEPYEYFDVLSAH